MYGDVGKKSILEMCSGAIQERADYEMTKLIENVLDPNTKPNAKRKVTITLELIPDDSRQNVVVNCTAVSKLAPTNPVTTMLYVADKETVLEMVPQVPGQVSFDGGEQEAPSELKLVKFA